MAATRSSALHRSVCVSGFTAAGLDIEQAADAGEAEAIGIGDEITRHR
jgi:hypothetical protein